MGLDKAIEHGKEKRKPYKGAKAISYSCRNHGGCDWCKENRLHKFKKKVDKNAIIEYYNDINNREVNENDD